MATQVREKTKDAIKLLKEDHEKVKGLFEQYSNAGDRAHKKKLALAEQIFKELEVHSDIEEQIFYPAFRKAEGKEGNELVDESLEEHHVVHLLIGEIRELQPEDDRFDAKMAVLCENVEHHIEEEEQEMFPDARKALKAQLETLGEQLERRKEELMQAR